MLRFNKRAKPESISSIARCASSAQKQVLLFIILNFILQQKLE